MANEIVYSARTVATKNGTTHTFNFSEDGLTMTGNLVADSIQSIGTTSTTFDSVTVSSPGILAIQNLDSTNYVEVDSSNAFTNFPQKIPAGQIAILRPQTTTIYGKANTAAVLLRIYFLSL